MNRDTIRRAKALAKSTGEAVEIMDEGGRAVIYRRNQNESRFASGDLTSFEFSRDLRATVTPSGRVLRG